MGMLRHWFKGRRIDHIVFDNDTRKTICGLTTKPVNDIRFLPFVPFNKNNHSYCKKCTKIYQSSKFNEEINND